MHIDTLAVLLIVVFEPAETLILRYWEIDTPLTFPHPAGLFIWAGLDRPDRLTPPFRYKLAPISGVSLIWPAAALLTGTLLSALPDLDAFGQAQNISPASSVVRSTTLAFCYQIGFAAVQEEPLFRGFLWGYLRRLGWAELVSGYARRSCSCWPTCTSSTLWARSFRWLYLQGPSSSDYSAGAPVPLPLACLRMLPTTPPRISSCWVSCPPSPTPADYFAFCSLQGSHIRLSPANFTQPQPLTLASSYSPFQPNHLPPNCDALPKQFVRITIPFIALLSILLFCAFNVPLEPVCGPKIGLTTKHCSTNTRAYKSVQTPHLTIEHMFPIMIEGHHHAYNSACPPVIRRWTLDF